MFSFLSMNYSDLMKAIDYGNDQRSHSVSCNLYKFDFINGILYFSSRSARSRETWNQRVQFTDWKIILPEEFEGKNLTWDETKKQIPEVVLSDIKVDCGCPAFLYWGSRYQLDQYDSSIFHENRFPSERDSLLEHILCKHLIAVFRRFFT